MIKRKLLRSLSLLLILLVLFIVRTVQRQFGKKQDIPKTSYYKVIAVHDGDTLFMEINGYREKIRLIGIDAPELAQKPWGRLSKEHLEGILKEANYNVSIEYDLQETDRYGRRLAYLWTEDKELVNQKMLEDGYALLLTIPPNIRYVDDFKSAQREAREKKSGVWGKKGLRETPKHYRERH